MGKSKRQPRNRMSPGHGLGAILSVEEFRLAAHESLTLTAAKRRLLVEQAEILLGEIYTHKPLKLAMHSID